MPVDRVGGLLEYSHGAGQVAAEVPGVAEDERELERRAPGVVLHQPGVRSAEVRIVAPNTLDCVAAQCDIGVRHAQRSVAVVVCVTSTDGGTRRRVQALGRVRPDHLQDSETRSTGSRRHAAHIDVEHRRIAQVRQVCEHVVAVGPAHREHGIAVEAAGENGQL